MSQTEAISDRSTWYLQDSTSSYLDRWVKPGCTEDHLCNTVQTCMYSLLGFHHKGLESKLHITLLSPLDKKSRNNKSYRQGTSFLFWAKRGVLLEPSSSTPLARPRQKLDRYSCILNGRLSFPHRYSWLKFPSTVKTNKTYVRYSPTYIKVILFHPRTTTTFWF